MRKLITEFYRIVQTMMTLKGRIDSGVDAVKYIMLEAWPPVTIGIAVGAVIMGKGPNESRNQGYGLRQAPTDPDFYNCRRSEKC